MQTTLTFVLCHEIRTNRISNVPRMHRCIGIRKRNLPSCEPVILYEEVVVLMWIFVKKDVYFLNHSSPDRYLFIYLFTSKIKILFSSCLCVILLRRSVLHTFCKWFIYWKKDAHFHF